jgi:hypothetical protein
MRGAGWAAAVVKIWSDTARDTGHLAQQRADMVAHNLMNGSMSEDVGALISNMLHGLDESPWLHAGCCTRLIHALLPRLLVACVHALWHTVITALYMTMSVSE